VVAQLFLVKRRLSPGVLNLNIKKLALSNINVDTAVASRPRGDRRYGWKPGDSPLPDVRLEFARGP
jgi:hypothetical protein